MSPDAPFDAGRYWEERHVATRGLEGVGYLGLGPYNDWMYRARAAVFRRALRGLPVRGARILDIGCGTGFWLDRWAELSAKVLVGIDVSPTAVARLSAVRPAYSLHHVDVTSAEDTDLEGLGRFDFISAIDVFYHIVDDSRYVQAFANVRRLLRPNGRLIFTENFLQHRPRATSPWQVSRTLVEIEAAMNEAGLRIEVRRPCFVLMNAPIDTQSRLLSLEWKLVERVVRRSKVAGRILGAGTYAVERLLTRLLKDSPSSELAVARSVE